MRRHSENFLCVRQVSLWVMVLYASLYISTLTERREGEERGGGGEREGEGERERGRERQRETERGGGEGVRDILSECR